jgi:Mrp family chromosome partitioning ATPase
MMKLLPKRKRTVAPPIEPFVLRSTIGTPLIAFSPEVITKHRRMITNLLYQKEIPARIAVLSTLQGEGVTYTTLAFGATMASDLPQKVCVVELNMWSPGLLTLLRTATLPAKPRRRLFRRVPPPEVIDENLLPSSLGVAGILAGTVSLEEALIPTSLPNLMLLPAGNLPIEERPVAARSEAIKLLIAQIAEQFDHIILDIPSVLASSDAVALAALADTVCLVVRQGVTPTTIVKQALDEIKHMNVVGVVLNQTRYHTPNWLSNLIQQE